MESLSCLRGLVFGNISGNAAVPARANSYVFFSHPRREKLIYLKVNKVATE
jgi:hypothetical protein